MPKFKFSNSAESTSEVTVLPCKNNKEFDHGTNASLATITYEFDNPSSMYLQLTIEGQWFRHDDIDEFIEFLKAAKKRGEKLALKLEQRSGGF